MSACAGFGPCSLSGVRLEGDRLVRLVYIDESGISNVRDDPFVIVAGIIVDADKKT